MRAKKFNCWLLSLYQLIDYLCKLTSYSALSIHEEIIIQFHCLGQPCALIVSVALLLVPWVDYVLSSWAEP